MLVILNIRHEDSLFSKINVFASLDSGCAGVGATRGAEDGSPRVDCRKFDESTVENVTRQRPRRAVPESVSCSLSTRVLATPRTARGSDDSSCRAFRSSASSVPVDIFESSRLARPQNEMAGGRVAIQTPQRRSRHARADTAEREQRPTSARTRPTRKCDERTDAAGARACASRCSRAVRETGTAAAAAEEIYSRTMGRVSGSRLVKV